MKERGTGLGRLLRLRSQAQKGRYRPMGQQPFFNFEFGEMAC